MPVSLTPNSISAIDAGDVNSKPLLQVLDIKLIESKQRRYRFIISDGISTQHALLATQLNHKVESNQVVKGSVIQLIDYICTEVQNKRIIVLLNIETIMKHSEILGNSRLFTGSESPKKRAILDCNSKNSDTIEYTFVQPPYQPPPPNYRNHGPVLRNEAPARIIPISALNPYQNRWAIVARVTLKGDLRRYNNAKGDGKVFSFDLLDSEGGEIRATCFNTAVDRFYEDIHVGKVYMITKASLKPSQKKFNHLKNDWEIFLEACSIVDSYDESDHSIPKQHFSFKSIEEIENVENNSILDIIGIVSKIGPSALILRKNGMETQRRLLNLKDDTGRGIELTLWGDFCNKEGDELHEILNSGNFPVLAVKAAKVSDFSGKCIGTISTTRLFINPEIEETLRLRTWFFEQGGKDASSLSVSRSPLSSNSVIEPRRNLSQIKHLGRSGKPDWVTVKATISFIKTDSFCYPACPLMVGERQCNKKVTKLGNEKWRCDRCDREVDECDYRYLLQAQVQDHTGSTWVTAFQESGEQMLGFSAKELYEMKCLEEEDDKFGKVIGRILFNEHLFIFKVKEEFFGNEQKVKVTVLNAEPVNYVTESGLLLDVILENQTY